MTFNETRGKILEHRGTLKQFGVCRIGFFGSYVHGQQRADSDIDLLVIFDKGQKTIDNYMHLYDYVESLFEQKVDLLTPEGISRYIRPYVEKEAVYEAL